jgi:membrane protease YdiL (CAAX protease family)
MYEVLDVDLGFNYQDLKVFIPVVGGLLGFVIYWFTWKSEKFQNRMIAHFGEERGLANIIIYTKIFGGFSMGVLPAVAYMIAFPETTLVDLGIGLSSKTLFATTAWTLGLGALMTFLIWNNARKPENLEFYPQIRSKKWTKKMMQGNLVSWICYLLGYEFLFRGVLLFPLVEEIGLWPAIAVNIAIYSATHIPKGFNETIGAIPLAIVLCLICVQTGNFWVAALVHVAMAYTNTLTSFKRHPEMNYIKT